MTHHPHIHMIVPGGISIDGSSWARCRSRFLLPVRVLSTLFRRLMLEKLAAAHAAGKLQFFGEHRRLGDVDAFAACLAPLGTTRWFVYSKRPFAGPQAVLAYLARYTHRVAISNRRLVALDADGVTFRYKDYRRNVQERYRTMTLVPGEFIRRFLLHVLPRASTASATTGSSPAPRARPTTPSPDRSHAPDRQSLRHRLAWARATALYATPAAIAAPTKRSRAAIKLVPCAAPDRRQPSNPHRPQRPSTPPAGSLYGAVAVKPPFHGWPHLIPSFSVRPGSSFLRPDPQVSNCWRAQGPSRSAVAQAFPQAPSG